MRGRQQLHQRGKLGLELLARELRRGGRARAPWLPPRAPPPPRPPPPEARSRSLAPSAESSASPALSAGKLRIAAAFGLALGKLCLELAGLRLEPGHARLNLGLLAVELGRARRAPRQAPWSPARKACSAASRLALALAAASRSCGSSWSRELAASRRRASPRQARASMPSASAICSSSRARSREACASRVSSSAWRALARASSRSSASRSTLKRCSTAARAASSSRKGWSFSAASACWRSASPSALVSCATAASACWNEASSCSTWAQAPTQCR